jgi:hypothetical protein
MTWSAKIVVAVSVISVETALSWPTKKTAMTANKASLFGKNGNRPTSSRIIDSTSQKPKCGPGKMMNHNKAHNTTPADNRRMWIPKIHHNCVRSSVNTRRENSNITNDINNMAAAQMTDVSV